jgi:hypothetical protein
MWISRGFLLIGSFYLLVGVVLGMYMGGSGDHTLAPVHAHINLLGFTLMTIFGLAYRVMPQMAGNLFAKGHFWLHQAGALVMLVGLFLMMAGLLPEATVVMVLPVSEISVFLGMLCWTVNLLRHG